MRLTISLVSISLMALSSAANAQRIETRSQTWELGFHVLDQSSLNIDGSGGSSLDIDSELGWGVYGAYNFTDHIAFGLDATWAKPKYNATRVIEGTNEENVIQAELSMFTFQAKGIFYMLDGPVAPYAEAGIGWTHVDSNILSGPPVTGCWWDPWWGYVCDTFFSTYSDSRTSYTLGLGVRWDMAPGLMLRGSVTRLELDTSQSTQDASFDNLRIDFAWRF